MSSISKNITHCRKCVAITPINRRIHSGSSSTIDTKLQAKRIVLNQWKLITGLKDYFSKITTDRTFEKALNKQFALFLQKIDAKTYGNGLIKYFSSESAAIKQIELRDTALSLPSVLNNLGLNIKSKEEKKEVIPKWKMVKINPSNDLLFSKTSYVLRNLMIAETEDIKTKHLESLIAHVKKHPEIKHHAVKIGAVRNLLFLRGKAQNPELKSTISEGLAVLGYADCVPGKGIRILSIDGGGVRGILVIEMLKKLEELCNKPLYEMFDLICGVSTGAIISTLLGLKQTSLDSITEVYKNISTQIFTQSALKGTSNLVWSHSYYDTALWETLLQEQWGDKSLIATCRNLKVPKFCAVSAVVNQSRLSAYVFRNYALPCKVQSQYMGNYNHKVWESVRASAAAPTYFEEFKIGNMLHQDGGILVNNPTAVAIHEAKLLWPTTPIQCVVSFGTGRTAPNPVDPCAQSINTQISNSSWKKKFFAIIDSATDTEGVHTMLSDLLPANVYYRFNPYLTEMLDIAEIDPPKLEQLKRDALMYLRRNEDKFHDAAKALKEKKSLTQQVLDWFNLQKEIRGFNQN